jgi:hypothetical protein
VFSVCTLVVVDSCCKDLLSEKLDIVFLFNLDYPDVDRVKNILMFLQSG